MSFLSHRLLQIKPSPTLAIISKAARLKAEGHDIISFGAGELDFIVPPFMNEAAHHAIDEGKVLYTAVEGLLPLREAIIHKFQQDNALAYDLDQIIVSSGAKQVLFNALLATLNRGDEVIIPAPYWVSYPDIVTFAEGVPIIVPCPPEHAFKLTPEALEQAITPRTKWLILNSPNNPTGAVYTRQELEALAEVLRNHPHVYVLSDDIYEYLVYKPAAFVTLAQVAPDLKERILVMNGISKGYASTGWRIGYGAGPKALIQAMITLQSQSTSSACTIAQKVALAALRGPQAFREEWIKSLREKQQEVIGGLEEIPGLTCFKPQGAFYLYPSCQGLIGKKTPAGLPLETDLDVAAYLLDSAGVAVVPGSAFGFSPYFRLSYTGDTPSLRKGCLRIKEAVLKLII